MQPPTNQTSNFYEHRDRLCQLLREFDDDQLRFILLHFLSNSTLVHQYTRAELLQQCLFLINNSFSKELEQMLLALRQQNQLPAGFQTQTMRYNTPNYRFSLPPPPPSPAITQQLRLNRPNSLLSQLSNAQNSRSHLPYNSSLLSQVRQSSSNIPLTNSSLSQNQRFQSPILPPPPPPPPPPTRTLLPISSSLSTISNPPSRLNINKIVHKTLPFYQPIACVYERYHVFQYDQYRKQYMSHDEFLLSFDACNQLSLSYDYDPLTNSHKTTKCLILRLTRIDQPPTVNGKYDDNLPPNFVIHINGHMLTNLPTPKPCTRQQNDLIRIQREIDITPNCMFNPILKNEIKIAWSYRSDNTVLHQQYAHAQYALHIFLVQHLTCEDLCNQICDKSTRFTHDDLAKFLAKNRAHDRDLGLEVSDQKLKLTCPIDQRHLKIPIRATTCQHLQCFDLTNYISLNEKANKWTCPVCNKYALFEDLQIDSYMETILKSFQDENITEILIDSDLMCKPVRQSKTIDDLHRSDMNLKNNSSTEIILIDDDN